MMVIVQREGSITVMWGTRWQAGRQALAQRLSAHILIHKQEAERTNTKVVQTCETSVILEPYLIIPTKQPPAANQVFKSTRLGWGGEESYSNQQNGMVNRKWWDLLSTLLKRKFWQLLCEKGIQWKKILKFQLHIGGA